MLAGNHLYVRSYAIVASRLEESDLRPLLAQLKAALSGAGLGLGGRYAFDNVKTTHALAATI